MSVQIVFTGEVSAVMHEMAAMLRAASTPRAPTVDVEVVDQPAANQPAQETPAAKEMMVLKDEDGQTYGQYDDEKALTADLLEMVAATESLDALKRLGDNNEAIADGLKKANANKIGKAFKEKRAALEATETEKAAAAGALDPDDDAPAPPKDGETVAMPGTVAAAAQDVPPAKDRPTAEDVKAVVGLVIATEGLGMPAGRQLFGKHGAARISELAADKYAACYEDARQLLIKAASEANADPLS